MFEDDDVWEILEEKADVAWEEYVESYYRRETDEYMGRVGMYFYGLMGGECRAHDRYGCPECSFHASGACPSSREEYYGGSDW